MEYMSVFHKLIQESLDTRLQNICTQDIDESLLGNFRFLRGRVRHLINDESHCMQTHVVDLDFFERATLLRLEQLGMKVEKTLVKRKKKIPETLLTPEKTVDNCNDEKALLNGDAKVEGDNQSNTDETTIVMYEIEKILNEQVNKCIDIFQLMDGDKMYNDMSSTKDQAHYNEVDDNTIVNILKIERKIKLSFDDILSSMHNDYYEHKYK